MVGVKAGWIEAGSAVSIRDPAGHRRRAGMAGNGWDEGPRRRIVVGVNGSPGSRAALRWAIAEARRTGAGLLAVHAWQSPVGERRALRYPDWPPVVEAREAAADVLAAAMELAFAAGVVADGELVRGAAAAALVRIADREGGLLVLGTGTRTGRFRAARGRGRVAAHCLKHARCPVLTVPPTAERSEATPAVRL
ncbi:universal stress protein [Kitasatospora sp. NPDC059722]|uniref:universal stress protein n=2 Tax=unclassified Kitasatospora TaxID=2633591 RepID=UPI00367EB111